MTTANCTSPCPLGTLCNNNPSNPQCEPCGDLGSMCCNTTGNAHVPAGTQTNYFCHSTNRQCNGQICTDGLDCGKKDGDPVCEFDPVTGASAYWCDQGLEIYLSKSTDKYICKNMSDDPGTVTFRCHGRWVPFNCDSSTMEQDHGACSPDATMVVPLQACNHGGDCSSTSFKDGVVANPGLVNAIRCYESGGNFYCDTKCEW